MFLLSNRIRTNVRFSIDSELYALLEVMFVGMTTVNISSKVVRVVNYPKLIDIG